MPASPTTSLKLKPETEVRQQLRRHALAAWTDNQATGRHVTAKEAGRWLARLETGQQVDPPSPQE